MMTYLIFFFVNRAEEVVVAEVEDIFQTLGSRTTRRIQLKFQSQGILFNARLN